jgi:hypothetical protein
LAGGEAMKQARFIQIIEVQKVLYALDEEGTVWHYGEDPPIKGNAWIPLTSKRLDEPASEPDRHVGF